MWLLKWLKDFEKNWHWGKLTIHEGVNDGTDGAPAGSQRRTWNGWSLRIAWHQVAIWRNYAPVINWLTPWSDRNYSHRKGLFIGNHAIITYGK